MESVKRPLESNCENYDVHAAKLGEISCQVPCCDGVNLGSAGRRSWISPRIESLGKVAEMTLTDPGNSGVGVG